MVEITVTAADGSSDSKTLDVVRVDWKAWDSNCPANRVDEDSLRPLTIRPDERPHESGEYGVSRLTVSLETFPRQYVDDFNASVSGMDGGGGSQNGNVVLYHFSHIQNLEAEGEAAGERRAKLTVAHQPTNKVLGDRDIIVGELWGGCEAYCLVGAGSASNSSIDFLINLGASFNGRESGSVKLYRSTPGADTYDPAQLRWLVSPNIGLYPNRESPTQALTSEVFAMVNDLEGDSFEIITYPAGAETEFDSETGLYGIDPEADFIYRYVFSNPDDPEEAQASLRIEQYSPEGLFKSYLYEWVPEASNWTLYKDNGTTRESVLRVTSEDKTVYTEIRKVQVLSGGNYTDVSEERTTYKMFRFGTRIREKVRVNGDEAQVTRWDYYENVDQEGVGGIHGVGSPRLIEYPDGNWTYYEYDSAGKVRLQASADGDTPFNGPASVMAQAHTVETIRSETNPVKTQITRHAGEEIAREFLVQTFAPDGTSHTRTRYRATEPGARWDDPENQWRSTETYSYRTNFGGYPKAVRASDGGATLYTYERDDEGILITTERRGTLSGDPKTSETFRSGTETIRRTDLAGKVIEEITTDIVTGATIDR